MESTNFLILKLKIKTKPQHFVVFQNYFNQKGNISIYSKNFVTKVERFYFIQKL